MAFAKNFLVQSWNPVSGHRLIEYVTNSVGMKMDVIRFYSLSIQKHRIKKKTKSLWEFIWKFNLLLAAISLRMEQVIFILYIGDKPQRTWMAQLHLCKIHMMHVAAAGD